MLVPSAILVNDAVANGYAVGSFNVASLEMIESVILAAALSKSPVIVSTSSAEARYFSPEVVRPIVQTLAERHGVTCALHLDHGDSFELAMRCLRAGYTSLMFDGSHFALDENIQLTKQVADAAHAVGVSVEGEVGRLSGVEDDLVVSAEHAHLTDVDEAIRFVAETNVDLLAVAVGNAHGFYLQEPQLDFERIEQIYSGANVPIVLHGGTGIPVEDIRRASTLGIGKVNIASRIRRKYMQTVHQTLAPDPNTTEVRDIMTAAKTAIIAEISVCMGELQSAGRG
ncbi:MAG: class II fructose-bisphosphate aldolase [Candidatus Promineifilaceae bacterium]